MTSYPFLKNLLSLTLLVVTLFCLFPMSVFSQSLTNQETLALIDLYGKKISNKQDTLLKLIDKKVNIKKQNIAIEPLSQEEFSTTIQNSKDKNNVNKPVIWTSELDSVTYIHKEIVIDNNDQIIGDADNNDMGSAIK